MVTADDDCSSVLQEVRGFTACSRRSDSGVRREGRQREKNKEEKREREGSHPYPTPSLFFSAHISLRCPHDLSAWNRLGNLGSEQLIEVRLIQDWV